MVPSRPRDPASKTSEQKPPLTARFRSSDQASSNRRPRTLALPFGDVRREIRERRALQESWWAVSQSPPNPANAGAQRTLLSTLRSAPPTRLRAGLKTHFRCSQVPSKSSAPPRSLPTGVHPFVRGDQLPLSEADRRGGELCPRGPGTYPAATGSGKRGPCPLPQR
jgi:hypothetical protein